MSAWRPLNPVAVAAVSVLTLSASAGASIVIDWYSVSPGGTVMTGGGIEIVGTAGQHDASPAMTALGGAIEIIGGFGAVYAPGQSQWTGAQSNSFLNPANWAGNVLPGAHDAVIFNNPTVLSIITLGGDASIGNLFVFDGNWNLQLQGGSTLSLLNDSPFAPSLIVGQTCDAFFDPQLIVSGNGTFETGSISLGDQPCSVGRLHVQGLQASLHNNGSFWIGRAGEGRFDVTLGAQALSQGGTISLGTATGSLGVGRVHGAVSAWTMQGDEGHRLLIGEEGYGRLNIQSGGRVVTSGYDHVTLGEKETGFGEVVISGTGSTWEVHQPQINVGLDGTGQIVLTGGGAIESGGAAASEPATFVLHPTGSIGGIGTISANVFSAGDLRPGDTTTSDASAPPSQAGTLTINGNYFQLGAGGLSNFAGRLHVGVGQAHDRLNVTGQAQIGGGLFVDVIGSGNPAVGEHFEFLTASSILDTFDVAVMPGLSQGRYLRVNYPQGGGVAGEGDEGIFISVAQLDNAFGFGAPQNFGVDGVPTSVVTADFNGDGNTDMALTLGGTPGQLLVLYGGPQAGFTGQQVIDVGSHPSAIAIGDFDNNGFLDIAVTNAGDDDVSILSNSMDGFLAPVNASVGSAPSAIVAGDLDTRGAIDLAVANAGEDTVHILKNDGDGSFSFAGSIATGQQPVALAAADFNKNGSLDLAIVNFGDGSQPGTLQVMGITGAGGSHSNLATLPIGLGPIKISVEDVDNNKDPDIIVVSTISSVVNVVRNTGGGVFAPPVPIPTSGTPGDITAFDMDGDGDVDFAVVLYDDAGESAVQILRNDSGGQGQIVLTVAGQVAQGESTLLLTSGDVEGDGEEDLITINLPAGEGAAGGVAGDAGTVIAVRPSMIVRPVPCPADLTDNGVVNVFDLLEILAAWGPCPAPCPADLDGNGVVNVFDMLEVLAAWGPCL